MHNLENSFYLQARAEDITLIDASVTPRTHSSYVFGEDFQTEFLTELLEDKSRNQVPELFQDDSSHRYKVDLDAEEKDERITVEQLLPIERPCEASVPRKKSENTISIYDLDKVDEKERQKLSDHGLEEIREKSKQHIYEVTTLNQPDASNLMEIDAQPSSGTQLIETGKEASTLDGVHWPELSTIPPLHERSHTPGLIAEDPIVIDGIQIAEDAQKQQTKENPQVNETLGAPGSKRRRLEGRDAATNTSNRNISFDLGNTQPCATSSAVKPKVPTQSPRLEIVPLSQLSSVQNPRRPPNRKRRKNHGLLVDENRQLSKVEMLENIRNFRDILRTRAECRAAGASLMHPRRVRSRYPDRLLALPANFELSISKTLAQMWRVKRKLCELGRLDEDLVPQKSQPSSMRHSKSNLWSIRESGLESSREVARGAVSEISMEPLAPRVSSFALQDQSNGEKHSLAMPSQSIGIPEEQIPQNLQKVNLEATLKPTEVVSQHGDQIEQPILEVQIPEMVQLEEKQPEPVIPEVPAVQQPELISGIPESYANESAFWATVKDVLKEGDSTVEFSRLISQHTSRKDAAKTFHHLLCLLKMKRVRVTQTSAFQPIYISLVES
ncbi:unnamed protein product [Hymenolepis diminuta]|uniref:Rad21/Rec8-like protein C-terminal eukaryotic domain-containing protein n=1 Tax=Hymenolepis diminuta TaxID=6216 RepID=A0A564Y193_HYMDI|nr:unnamed protein product [Hymenolepis diminuta]